MLVGDCGHGASYLAGPRDCQRDDVTVVFVANDQMALGLTWPSPKQAAESPRTSASWALTTPPGATFYLPPLTTIRQDFAGASVGAFQAQTAVLGQVLAEVTDE